MEGQAGKLDHDASPDSGRIFLYPREAAEKLSRSVGLPLAKIYGVITFYHYFKTTKPGKHKLAICLGTACYLKGAQDLIDEARAILNIKGDEVTDDGLFSIDEVRCLGCCGLAPVLMIGNEVFGKVTKDQLPEIIAKCRNEKNKEKEYMAKMNLEQLASSETERSRIPPAARPRAGRSR